MIIDYNWKNIKKRYGDEDEFEYAGEEMGMRYKFIENF